MVPTFMEDDLADLNSDAERRLKGGGSAPAPSGDLPPGLNWISRVEDQLQIPFGTLSVTHAYALCLEYALGIMCMGYASVTQENLAELWYSVFCMLIAGALYAYMIGGICGALAMEDPAETHYKESMDLLMKFMDEKEIPPDMKIRAFEYLEYCKPLMQHQFHVQVLELMPKSLRGDICLHTNGPQLSRMKFFNASDERENREFCMAVSCVLEPVAFPPNETIYVIGDRATCLYIITRGLVKHMKQFQFRILIPEDHFGEEMVVEDYNRHATARTLSYAECSQLFRDSLFEILDARPKLFKDTRHKIRREAIRLQLHHHITTIGYLVKAVKRQEGLQPLTQEDVLEHKRRYRSAKDAKQKALGPKVDKSDKDEEEDDCSAVVKLKALTGKEDVKTILLGKSTKQ